MRRAGRIPDFLPDSAVNAGGRGRTSVNVRRGRVSGSAGAAGSPLGVRFSPHRTLSGSVHSWLGILDRTFPVRRRAHDGEHTRGGTRRRGTRNRRTAHPRRPDGRIFAAHDGRQSWRGPEPDSGCSAAGRHGPALGRIRCTVRQRHAEPADRADTRRCRAAGAPGASAPWRRTGEPDSGRTRYDRRGPGAGRTGTARQRGTARGLGVCRPAGGAGRRCG